MNEPPQGTDASQPSIWAPMVKQTILTQLITDPLRRHWPQSVIHQSSSSHKQAILTQLMNEPPQGTDTAQLSIGRQPRHYNSGN